MIRSTSSANITSRMPSCGASSNAFAASWAIEYMKVVDTEFL